MLHRGEQRTDGMAGSGATQILCSHMQINLCTRDLPMSKKITDRDETHSGTHQVRCKRMSQSMRTQWYTHVTALSPGTYALVYCPAAQGSPKSGPEERRGRQCCTPGLHVLPQYLCELRVERDRALMSAFAMHGDGESDEVDLTTAKRGALGGTMPVP